MPELRLRLNGVEIKHIRIQREMVNGYPIGKQQLAVEDPVLGWFVIDDNRNLWDQNLPKFVLEYHWVGERGWQQVSPESLLAILASTALL